MCFASASRRLATSSSVYSMGFDLSAIRMRLLERLELSRLRTQLVLLQRLQRASVKLQEQFPFPPREPYDQAATEAVARQTTAQRAELFTNASQALSQWVTMEELLIGVGGAAIEAGRSQQSRYHNVLYPI